MSVVAPAPSRSADASPSPSWVARALVAVVRAYQRWISPMFGPHCRFAPTCSTYAVTALSRHGALRGGWLAVRRIARCHPFNPGGVDPVPPAHHDHHDHRPTGETRC